MLVEVIQMSEIGIGWSWRWAHADGNPLRVCVAAEPSRMHGTLFTTLSVDADYSGVTHIFSRAQVEALSSFRQVLEGDDEGVYSPERTAELIREEEALCREHGFKLEVPATVREVLQSALPAT